MKRRLIEVIKGETGQVLPAVLVLMLIGGLLIAPSLSYASTSLNAGRIVEKKVNELYAADAGVEYALYRLGNNPGAFGPESLPSDVNDRTVTVTVTVEDLDEHIYKVTSTATSPDGSSTTIESYVKVLFTRAITVTDGGASLFQSDVEGDIYVSGKVSLRESVVIGTITEDGTEEFDVLDTEPYKTEAQNGGIIEGDLVLPQLTTTSLGPVYITGSLEIGQQSEITLGGTVYVEEDIKIEQQCIITGEGNIIAEAGDIEIEQQSTFDLDNLPLVMAAEGDIKLGQECGEEIPMKATLYAPEGNLDVDQKQRIDGALFGKTLSTELKQCHIKGIRVLEILTWQISR